VTVAYSDESRDADGSVARVSAVRIYVQLTNGQSVVFHRWRKSELRGVPGAAAFPMSVDGDAHLLLRSTRRPVEVVHGQSLRMRKHTVSALTAYAAVDCQTSACKPSDLCGPCHARAALVLMRRR
jgi:hypothetical protein